MLEIVQINCRVNNYTLRVNMLDNLVAVYKGNHKRHCTI